MNKTKVVTLDNGLKIILGEDKTKHRSIGALFVFAGGNDTFFYKNDEEIHMPKGVAHFLEHYLLEHSMYGDATTMFSNDYIETNGLTSSNRTYYYINTVHDFKENLVKLLRIVNEPIFKEEDIHSVKKPILSEINQRNDRPNNDFYKYVFDSIYDSIEYDPTLGEVKDIANMDIYTLKSFHDAFYRPSNQMLILSGNFDSNEIVKLVEDTYNSFNVNEDKIVKNKKEESPFVIRKDGTFIDDTKNEYLKITFKIKIDMFSPLEKNKLDYYFSYLLKYNFGDSSPLFDSLIKDKLTLYSIDYDYDPETLKDYVILSIGVYTSEFDKVSELVLHQMKNLEHSTDEFKIWKNNKIIDIINSISKNFTNNVLFYDLYQYDDINFIKSLDENECIEFINKLDLSNYSIIQRINEDEKQDNYDGKTI